ncbi:hypothetical protein DXT98_31130 [Agrobacterium sp. ICMP 7243]|nr:hypothetical protein DXT98_31130 [Agrobacterium sp. ICMP 7243]MQB34682.1 hypothetical protein [Rhizobium rhizogenes]TQO73466.1 hypothetical protein FFE80_31635 [Rhizobium rhizogenes]TRB50551.1 hypothetical protein EXN69_31355 [Rhizobium rhizogenes]
MPFSFPDKSRITRINALPYSAPFRGATGVFILLPSEFDPEPGFFPPPVSWPYSGTDCVMISLRRTGPSSPK